MIYNFGYDGVYKSLNMGITYFLYSNEKPNTYVKYLEALKSPIINVENAIFTVSSIKYNNEK